MPHRAPRGHPGARLAARATLYEVPREERLSAFAAATGIRKNEVHRMLNPCHAAKIGRLEEAPPFSKKRLVISVEETTPPSIRAGSDFDPLAGTASTSNAWPTGHGLDEPWRETTAHAGLRGERLGNGPSCSAAAGRGGQWDKDVSGIPWPHTHGMGETEPWLH